MLIPWLYLGLRNIRTTAFAYLASATVFGALAAYMAGRFPTHDYMFDVYWFPVEFPIFLLGILVFQVWSLFGIGNATPIPSRRTLSTVLLLATAAMARPHSSVQTLGFGAATLVFALSLYPWRLFVNGFTRYMGKISYSVYMFHFYVNHTINLAIHQLDAHTHNFYRHHLYGTFTAFGLQFALCLAISAVIGTLSWMYLEQPFIRLGRRLIRHLEHRSAKPLATLVPESGELLSPSNTPDSQY